MKKILNAIALALLIAAVVFGAGCAQKAPIQGNENVSPANETVNPINITTGTGQIVNENDSGKTISLQNGKIFTLILRENPSTGYHWDLNVSNGLNILISSYTQDQAPSGMAGVPGNRTYVIQATAPGSQQVTGYYIPPGRNITGAEQNFTLTVDVI